MQPIDYGVQIQDPSQSFLSAFQTGTAIQDTRLKQQQQQQQMANQKVILEGLAKIRQPGATVEDVSNLAMILPKDQSETVLKAFALKTDAQKQNSLNQAGRVVSALLAGENDIAQNLITEQANAMRNSGNEEGAKFLETWRGVTEVNPTASQNFFTAELLRLPGGDKIVENIVKLRTDNRAEAKAPFELTEAQQNAKKATSEADIKAIESQFTALLQKAGLDEKNWNVKNLQSQIGTRAAQLNLDTQTMQATVAEKLASIQSKLNEVPADTRKLVNESAVAAATSKQSADQLNDLAKRLEAAGGGYGAFSNASELVKKGLGLQGGLTQLRQEYTRLRNTSAVKSLPPGAASDADINLALQPFPSENADAKYMASFLRGMAKLQDIESAVANAKTDWLASNNGALTRAKDTFKAGDYVTKPGESFSDFTQRVTQDYSKRYNPATQTNLVNQIPTDRNPAPAAAANNIRSQADAILSGGR